MAPLRLVIEHASYCALDFADSPSNKETSAVMVYVVALPKGPSTYEFVLNVVKVVPLTKFYEVYGAAHPTLKLFAEMNTTAKKIPHLSGVVVVYMHTATVFSPVLLPREDVLRTVICMRDWRSSPVSVLFPLPFTRSSYQGNRCSLDQGNFQDY